MTLVHELAEARIREAMEKGELENLAGAGRPLRLDADRHVPAELRAAYRVLRDSGFLPPEVLLRREIADVSGLLSAARCDEERTRAARRLEMLRMRLAHTRRPSSLARDPAYETRLLERFSRQG